MLAEHNDHLTVSKILLNSETLKLSLGLNIQQLSVTNHNFTGNKQICLNVIYALESNT